MKLALRTDRNQRLVLDPGTRFVEILNRDQELSGVVYPDAQDQVLVARPGSKLFEQYVRLFRIEKYVTSTRELPDISFHEHA